MTGPEAFYTIIGYAMIGATFGLVFGVVVVETGWFK